jgi:hypothetical protein
MSIQFVPATPAVMRHKIIVDGKFWGTVFPYDSDISDNKYQCQLNFKGLFNPGGFGKTMEEAVENTIKAAHDQMKEMSEDLNAFLSAIEGV